MNPSQIPETIVNAGKKNWPLRICLILALAGSFVIVLRLLGLVIPYSYPSSAMAPTVNRDGRILMEGFTYLKRKPQRGDVVVFKTEGIAAIVSPPGSPPEGAIYIKRLVGEPGDKIRLADGKIYINGLPAIFSNEYGKIHFTNIDQSQFLRAPTETIAVPAGHYFVLGDNSPKSADSRFFGFVPAGNIKGKAAIRFWPPARAGSIR